MTFYLTTAIPYVNAAPHIGFTLEIVQADALARHKRGRGEPVRFLTGTDDNSLKNVKAAAAEGVTVEELVARNAALFEGLRGPLDLSFDDFIRTGSDPRHRPGVEKLWRACEQSGDLYKKHYEGRYCVGCEQFYAEADLADGKCPEHGVEPQLVAEENWFFRLSRYGDRLKELIISGELRVEPESRRNEVLSLIESGLHDFSISRSRARAHGWGVPVPGDPDQVVYVWYDALGNYITALGYGSEDDAPAPDFDRWWTEGDRRVHVIGKGIIRFHAVYWPAMLLSAGVRLPSDIFVHDYVTVDGRKIGKSLGNTVDPVALAGTYGADALRWWLLREVPRVGDADFTVERLVTRANEDLANGLGNLVNRVVSMAWRYRDGAVVIPDTLVDAADRAFAEVFDALPAAVGEAVADFDFRAATGAIVRAVDAANRFVETNRPWDLAKGEKGGSLVDGVRLDTVLSLLVHACRVLGAELAAFTPGLAARVAEQCGEGTTVAPAAPVYPRLEVAESDRVTAA
ncbi:methionine--tRNA ligase [Phytomonospora endophytica]|uniref:methionine--tRNA ligase n=1 Tax=Phytomonospora endophytica TaxID=714109 RepID=A0A841FKU9_9ACTN|nr:methionine--tRNA ligase [Phytomonospora endophytica]MBB6036515.1 methionyl-tRNA synthetase [Phytomonospora endophytica]GIG65837.1 methionine--tRNA ligase [Phytomonospora endophytica]